MNIMLVTGEPGIGKSALVLEMDKHVAARQGIFISGKFDQLRRYVPYSAIIQAYQDLARRLLTESDEQVQKWREKLLDALGSNSSVITDIIPEISVIIGQQPEVPELEPREARNRFKRVFKNFLGVFTDRAHPLVLFLDDLQWADPDSIELLKDIAFDRDQGFFFFIGAFRDADVPPHHPMMLAAEEIMQGGGNIETLRLEPLEESRTNRIISGFLRCLPEDSAPLASVIQEKTLGNPFFVNQFLKDLYESGEIEPAPSGGWKWNLESITQMQVTDNVVDFMAEKIQRLPAESMEIIKICACAGNRFDAWTLCELSQKPINSIVGIMESLVTEELFTRKGSFYTFSHDRIQEAAYSLLSADESKYNHYHIGSLELANTPEEELFYKIFYIVDQLNEGRDLIGSEEEGRRLAELNLLAGRKAKRSTAFDAAVNYFHTGVGLLPLDSWKSGYSLTYELYMELMQCRYMARDFKGAEQIFEEIIENARQKKDKARAYTVMIVLYTNMRSPMEAIRLGIEALRLFGGKFSLNTGPVLVLAELLKVKFRLGKMHPDEILDLPMMEDEERIAYHNLMLSISTPAYYVNPNLFALLTLKGANEILKQGLNNTAASTFISLATIIENVLGDYELGYRLGKTALALNEKLDNRNLSGPVYHVFAFFIQHWKNHAARDIDIYKKVYQLCMDAGNLIFAGHSVNAVVDCRLMIGHRLDDILDEAEKYRDFIHHIKDPFIKARYMENLQMARCLKAMTKDRLSLSGPEFDESGHLSRLYRQKNLFGVCYSLLYKTKLLYLYGEYKDALNTAEKLDSHINVPVGTLVVPEHYFYYCLTLAALLKDGSTGQRRKRFGIIRKYLRQMKRWAQLCQENFGHKHDLILAEVKAAKGQFWQAGRLYRQAVHKARESRYLNEEALACERTAIFYS
ncbi:MAG: ATP-binding protein, partial [Desulfosalsimonas sp.]